MGIQIEIAIIGLIQAVMVAVIAGLFARDSKKRKKAFDDAEVRALLRAEESLLTMKMIYNNMGLSVATALAYKEGKPNGEMDSALQKARNIEKEYTEFIGQVASKKMHE